MPTLRRDVLWWPPAEVAAYGGHDLFAPRDLATPLTALINDGLPAGPLLLLGL